MSFICDHLHKVIHASVKML